jgi:phage terminase small subunit
MSTDRPDGTPYAPRSGPVSRSQREVTLMSRAPKGLAIRDQRTRRFARRLMVAFPWLTPADRGLVMSFCQVKILVDECYAKIRLDGLTRSDGHPHYLLSEFRSLVRVEADLAGRLGLTPRDRAQMRASSTTAALERVDLTRVEKILRARGAEPALEDGEIDADNSGSD